MKQRPTPTHPLTILLILTTTLIPSTFSWHNKGHLTIARIAEIHLSQSENGKKAFIWASSILAPFTKFCGEADYPFTESATWADKVKYQGWLSMSSWHFIDKKIFAPGYTPKEGSVDPPATNVITSINSIVKHLISTSRDKQGGSKTIFGKSISLRNLIHFVGDIHQPLHCSSRYSELHKKGDYGGNRFLIKFYENKKIDNLHYLWDHLFSKKEENVQSPL